MFRTAAVVAVLGFAAYAARAEACSCAGGAYVWPRDGEVDVPANVRLLVADHMADDVVLIRTSDGATIPLETVDQVTINRWTTSLLRPSEPLALGVYQVQIGALVSTFATSSSTDETAPTFEGATALTPQQWRAHDQFSSCWSFDGTDRLRFEHAPLPDDVLGAVAVLRRQDEPTPFWRGIVHVYGDAPHVTSFGTDICTWAQLPQLEAGITYCARLSVFDLAGNESGGEVEVCGLTRECWLADVLEEPRDDTVCRADPRPPVVPDAGDGGADAGSEQPDAMGTSSDSSGGGCSVSRRHSSASPLALVVLGALLLRRRRDRMLQAAALVGAFGALAFQAPAEACSCGGGPYVWPRDGETEVPSTVRLLVMGLDLELGSVTLVRVSDEAAIPLTTEEEIVDGRNANLGLRPAAPLEVGVYEVQVAGTVVSTFATTSLADDVPPAFAGATALAPEQWRPETNVISSCWSFREGTDHLRIQHDALAPDVVAAKLELRREGEPVAWRGIRHIYQSGSQVTDFSTDSCSLAQLPRLEEGVTYCARLSVFDASGNTAGGEVEVCDLTRGCVLHDLEEEPASDSVCMPPPGSGGGGCSVGGRPSTRGPLALLALGALLLRTAVSRRRG